MAKAKQRPDLVKGDEVYVQHPKHGPMAVRVVAVGNDGFYGECEKGERHPCDHGAYLGHRKRVIPDYSVVDQGADGALLKDENGKSRYVAGEVHPAADDGAGDVVKPTEDDPLTGGLGRLTKAAPMLPDKPILFLKAVGQAVANRPGLALKKVTDRRGHTTQRWARTSPKPQPERREPAKPEPEKKPLVANPADRWKTSDPRAPKHEGKPKLEPKQEEKPRIRSAAEMEQVKREQQQKYEAGRDALAKERRDGADDAQRRIDAANGHTPPTPREPERPEPAPGKAPIKHGDLITFRHGDVQGKGKVVASGADGVTAKDENGREHQVRHEHVEGKAPDQVGTGGDTGDAANPETKPLFSKDELAHLPAKAKQPEELASKDALYKASGEALEHLKTWLDKGKGVCAKLGYQTMTTSAGKSDLSQPGGMLFIGKLKGEERAAEKVEADYGGDWSQLKDTVRCSIAVDTMDDIADALEQLKQSGMVLAQQPKDRFAKPTAEGYRDLMLNVKFPNGLVGEVQLHLKSMLAAKSEGHKAYETMRSVDAKPREQWTEEDGEKWQQAFEQSKRIYDGAWARAESAKGAPDETKEPAMAKALASVAAEWEFYDRDGAKFRRPAGKPGGVTDVLHGEEWKPYTGDRTAAYLEGDRIDDPLGGGGDGEPMAKGGPGPILLFLKAQIPGGAAGDLFPSTVSVPAHIRGGKVVQPYQATRHKRPDEPAPVVPAAPGMPEPGGDLDQHLRSKGLKAVSGDVKHFYVSAIDGPKRYLVAGPYGSDDEAKGMVEHVRRHAAEHQPGREAFMAWGTAGSATPLKTPLGENWKPAAR